jgi:Sulfotransferase domain
VTKLPRWVRAPRWTLELEVPEVPPGWRTGPPDFVGVGAQRAGTSWWYRTIEQHPQVVRIEDQAKELHFFDRFWQGDLPSDFVERYHALFPRPAGSITGEWTPRYMYDFWSLRLLAHAAPDARILVLLRDPVERYRSGLARHNRHAYEAEAPVNLMMLADGIARGLYEQQLRRVFDFFDRGQVLVQQYESCVADLEGELAVTCRFLGLEPFEALPPPATERKRPPNPKDELSGPMREDLVARLEDDVRRLAALCPEVDLSLWPDFAHLAGAAVADPAASGGSAP